MKALAILAACFVAASPSFAAPTAASHAGPAHHVGPAPHPGRAMMGGRHRHHGQRAVIGLFNTYGPEVLTSAPAPDQAEPEIAVLPQPTVVLAPGPYCPPLAPVRMRHTGPRIIYIGQQPTRNDGPTVIYGAY